MERQAALVAVADLRALHGNTADVLLAPSQVKGVEYARCAFYCHPVECQDGAR